MAQTGKLGSGGPGVKASLDCIANLYLQKNENNNKPDHRGTYL